MVIPMSDAYEKAKALREGLNQKKVEREAEVVKKDNLRRRLDTAKRWSRKK